ncbi:MAG: DNA polymerase III subunit gamma/tau [Clostridia bacterium]
MSYIALYRKYRPDTFDGIVGQENVTKILKNQIKTGKISHAYIFSGSRGTGKTSAAKVFARAINCLNPKDGEPCNECKICKSILDGNTTDVVEMDAASNNSVDNIRQIRQEVVYATIEIKYRVYIIDEAHMLTTSAFNALLKTLEEPPENVVFILATTEQHKIPVTILSRCLRFEFNRIVDSEIINRLVFVLNEEGLKYELDALSYIAKLAEGGLRDALSILDRCISETQEVLKYEDVLRIVGAIDKQVISSLVDNITQLDSDTAMLNIDNVIQKGKDLRQLVYQITEEFLNRLMITTDITQKNRIIKIIDRLSKLENEIMQTTNPVIVLKSSIIELCSLQNCENTADGDNSLILHKVKLLEDKIDKLNEKLKDNNILKNNLKVAVNNVDDCKNSSNEDVKIDLVKFEKIDELKKIIVQQGKLKLYSALAGAKVYMDNKNIIIITDNSFAYSILTIEESINDLLQVFKESYDLELPLRVELVEKKEEKVNKVEKLFKENNVNFTQID